MKALKFAATGMVTLSLVLTGCGGSTPAAPAAASAQSVPEGVTLNKAGGQAFQRNDVVEGGSLRIGLTSPVESLDPLLPLSNGGAPVARGIFDALFVYDENGKVTPELAKSIETTDEGKTWTLKLPTDVSFTDGTPFNSEAVVAHLTRIGAEDSRSRSAGDARNIASMDTPDDATVVFTLKNATMLFPKLLTVGTYGAGAMVPSPTAVEKYGKEFGTHPVGVGPFMVESFKAGAEITLAKNPNYRIKGLPHLDKLVYIPAVDTQSRLAAAVAGDIDLASTQSAVDLRQAADGGLVSVKQPDSTYYNLLFNLEREPFSDPRFRKAVIQGIDLEGLNQVVFEGLHTPMTGLFPRSNPFYVETGWPSFNPDEARKLVEEYVKETGNKAEFSLTTTSPPEFQKQAQVMQQMLADVGITVNLKTSDSPTMVTEALSGNYDAQHGFFSSTNLELGNGLRNNFHSTSPANNGQVGIPEVDALLDQLNTAESEEELKALYTDLQKELTAWMPIVPLIAHQNGWYLGQKVGGFPGAMPNVSEPDLRQVWIAK